MSASSSVIKKIKQEIGIVTCVFPYIVIKLTIISTITIPSLTSHIQFFHRFEFVFAQFVDFIVRTLNVLRTLRFDYAISF